MSLPPSFSNHGKEGLEEMSHWFWHNDTISFTEWIFLSLPLCLCFTVTGQNVLRWKSNQVDFHGRIFKSIFLEGRCNGKYEKSKHWSRWFIFSKHLLPGWSTSSGAFKWLCWGKWFSFLFFFLKKIYFKFTTVQSSDFSLLRPVQLACLVNVGFRNNHLFLQIATVQRLSHQWDRTVNPLTQLGCISPEVDPHPTSSCRQHLKLLRSLNGLRVSWYHFCVRPWGVEYKIANVLLMQAGGPLRPRDPSLYQK